MVCALRRVEPQRLHCYISVNRSKNSSCKPTSSRFHTLFRFQMITLYPVSILLLIHVACAFIYFSPDLNPRNLSIVSQNSTALTLSWLPPDVPEVGTRKYMIRLNGQFFHKTNKTKVTLSGLKPSTAYKVTVLTIKRNNDFVTPGTKLFVKMADID
uniref:Fibronectin type III domain n=1 Tax=Schistocephalus solidus TaxID=70667 RepID=A0A0X3PXN4_SCHSO